MPKPKFIQVLFIILTLILVSAGQNRAYANACPVVIGEDSVAVKGVVTDENNEPAIFATVRIDFYDSRLNACGEIKTLTDFDGIFEIKIPPTETEELTLKVYYVAYLTKIVLIKYQPTSLRLKLNPDKSFVPCIFQSINVPLIDRFSPGGSKTFNAEDIEKAAH